VHALLLLDFLHQLEKREMKSTIKSLGLLAVALTVTFLGTSALAAQVQPPSPSSAWLLDEGSGPATADAFGAFNGTLTGVISWSSDTPFAYIGNNSVDFGGFDLDYINVGAAIPTGGSALPDFTISGWTKASTAVDWGLMGSWNTGGAGGSQGEKGDFMLRQIGAGNLQLIIAENFVGGGIKLFEPSLSVPDGQWSHVAMTATNDFSSVSIYVDGVGETGAPHFIGFGYDPLADTRLGGTGYVMDGLGDEFALWDSALSADNIEWLRTNSLSAIPEPTAIILLSLGMLGLVSYRRRK
jgi:hypothetical protein